VNIQGEVFYIVMQYSVVAAYQHFGGAAFLFILKMEAAWTSKIMISHHNIIWCHSPEDPNLKIYLPYIRE
jgi:hypothetical protein